MNVPKHLGYYLAGLEHARYDVSKAQVNGTGNAAYTNGWNASLKEVLAVLDQRIAAIEAEVGIRP